MSFARSALANRFSALVLTAATATLALPLAAAPGVEGSLSAVQGDARVTKALDALRADGTLAEISTKWFGQDVTQ